MKKMSFKGSLLMEDGNTKMMPKYIALAKTYKSFKLDKMLTVIEQNIHKICYGRLFNKAASKMEIREVVAGSVYFTVLHDILNTLSHTMADAHPREICSKNDYSI